MAILNKANAQRAERRYWGDREMPKAKTDFFGLVTTPNTGGDGSIATLRIYGPVDSWGGLWGVSAQDVTDVLDKLSADVTQVIVRVNSPGGEVFEGLAILNALRAHKASMTAVVDGLAASAASIITSGLDECVMSPGSMLMIHSPWTFSIGSSADLRKDAEVLDSIERSIVSVYRDKAGEKDWAAILAAETWLADGEAVDFGLADRVAVIADQGVSANAESIVIPPTPDPIVASATEFLRAATRAQRAAAAHETPDASATGDHQEGVAMSDDINATAPDALEDAQATPATAPEVADEPAAADETVVLDKSTFAELQRQAAAGRDAEARAHENAISEVLDAAIRAGKFAESRRGHFEAHLRADFEGTKQTIEALASLTTEVGFDASAEHINDTTSGTHDTPMDALRAAYAQTKKEH
jgi:ATP-dependent protease ClpP protease subunit